MLDRPARPAGGAGSGGPGRRIALPLKPIRCALEAAQVLAGRITATAPVAVRMAKTLLREGGDAPLSAGLQLEQAVGAVLYATDDAKEGIAAFVGKRKPEFRGQ